MMHKRFVFFAAIFLAAITGCSGSRDVSPDMKGFMEGLAKSDIAADSLKKYGAPGLDTKDMDMYDLKNPRVIKTEKKENLTCYTMRASAGVTTRSYVLCWKNNKIVSVDDKGFSY